jgi:ABC-type phosphate transport system ATPase subunit
MRRSCQATPLTKNPAMRNGALRNKISLKRNKESLSSMVKTSLTKNKQLLHGKDQLDKETLSLGGQR